MTWLWIRVILIFNEKKQENIKFLQKSYPQDREMMGFTNWSYIIAEKKFKNSLDRVFFKKLRSNPIQICPIS
ncbi:hypothetical protein DGG96_17095 [Legionella qingyii]|uniref:Uncharacterized protein n=1 Tax=Legionella qingyii TaxID=2184757 RepID=A0A317TXT3_9GAMM|nr:hypothetical protein DGG96_17095 [Legionella qingyii]